MDAAIIGVDLAKRVIQIHGAEKSGETVYRKKLTREQFYRFMTEIPSCIVAFEACGSANHDDVPARGVADGGPRALMRAELVSRAAQQAG